jgi:thiosulfate/3-mercaptopyruvate sulfurtransferase
MAYTTLISTSDLASNLDHPDWLVVDCRFQLKDFQAGRQAYEQSHIAGAVFADLNADLSGPILPGKTSRHPLPPVDVAAQRFSDLGIDGRVQVVAYDDQGGALAAVRLWWMLRWLGHEHVAVLDGGWQKWIKEERPTHSGVEYCAARTFVPQVRPHMLVDANDVLRSIGDPAFPVFDARSADRYRGENETIDPVAGHIPGAVSAPYMDNLDQEGVFKSQEELRTKYRALLGGLQAAQSAFYCGSGGTAPHDILAMMRAGLGEAKLYAGSWSDWILDPNRPVKTGNEDE